MDFRKINETTYEMTDEGYTIRIMKRGSRGFSVINSPPLLCGTFTTLDGVKVAFLRHLSKIADTAAIEANPLINEPPIDFKGTILDPDLKYGPRPVRSKIDPPKEIPF